MGLLIAYLLGIVSALAPRKHSGHSINPTQLTENENGASKNFSPLYPKIPPSPTNASNACKCCQHKTPGWKVFLEIGTFLAALVAAGATGYYAYKTNKTLKQVAAQTIAMQRANGINSTTAAISQRAYIIYPESAFSIAPTHSKDNKPAWELLPGIENGGNTPAFNLNRSFNDNYPKSPELPEDFGYPDVKSAHLVFDTMPSGGPIIVGPHDRSNGGVIGVLQSHLTAANSTEHPLYLYGGATYDDVFGCRHKTEFCWKVVGFWEGPAGIGHLATSECPKHNCADKDCSDYTPTQSPVCGLEEEPLK